MNTKLSPPPKPVRLTITVSPEVHSAFQRISTAGNTSIGRSMGDWLADTLDAAEFMASTMERARLAPKLAVQELHAYALSMTEETAGLISRVKGLGALGKAAIGSDASFPPSCNTGGKVPKPKNRAKGSKSGFPLPPASVQAYADTNGVPPKASK